MQRICAFVLLAMIAVPNLAFAWGRDGHEIVATIAEARLTDRAKAGIKDLLGDKSLASVANWADEIRKQRDETSTWHYVDIPYEMRGLDLIRDGKNGNNIVDKLVEFAGVLNDPKQPRDKRVEALKFLVHFTGDIHQPLHCAERNEDKGGNMRLVFFMEEPEAINLHKVWDSTLVKYDMNKTGKTSVKAFSEQLNKQIDEKVAKTWIGGDPAQWANESHGVAVKIVYADVPVDGNPPKLGEKYLDAAVPAMELQLEKGGVRLADVLNRIYR